MAKETLKQNPSARYKFPLSQFPNQLKWVYLNIAMKKLPLFYVGFVIQT